MVVGKMFKFAISPMSLAGQVINWCDQVKYLGAGHISGAG